MIRDTSLSSYTNVVLPYIGEKQNIVLGVIKRHKGITNSEIAEELGWSINRITGRVKELRDFDLVRDGGIRSCKVTKQRVHEWI